MISNDIFSILTQDPNLMRAHTRIFLNSSKNLLTIHNIDIDLLSKSIWILSNKVSSLDFKEAFRKILYKDFQKNLRPFGLFTRIFFKTKNENKSQKIFQISQKGFWRNVMKKTKPDLLNIFRRNDFTTKFPKDLLKKIGEAEHIFCSFW